MLWFLTAAQAACDTASLTEELVASEKAFADLDDEIDARRVALTANLGCLDTKLGAATAALTHRTLALYAFLDEDDAKTAASFGRYRALASDPSLPLSLAPSTHPLRTLFDGAPVSAESRDIPAPKRGEVLIDGTPGPAPADLPFLLQHIEGDGRVALTALVQPGQPLPPYEAASGNPQGPPKRSKVPLLVAGGAALAVGGVLYGAAFTRRNAYEEAVARHDVPVIKATHAQTNTLATVGVGLLGGGAAVLIVGVL